ncbi:MAG: hypothetical protein O9327_01605, partial [Polaromonas sp.]|nr:hypothetical protein [Polaromonas sp.]
MRAYARAAVDMYELATETSLFKIFQTLFSAQTREANAVTAESGSPEPPAEIAVVGLPAFAISPHLSSSNGLPFLDWVAVQAWVDAIEDAELQARAWTACERAWLEHMCAALGPSYRLVEEGDVILLSTLEPNVVRATLGFVAKTLKKITILLDGIAQAPEWGKDILIVFDDEDTYYRYVSHYYPEAGEFAGSSGMYINFGCGHFATVKADLRAIEPVIAHELTHSCVSHLPIPAWLNEGLAVNTEHRLSPPGPSVFTPRQMHEKHRQFWGEAEIQEFWSGKSFLRNDDANMLSYDLARIIVAQLSE